ncbi:MAG: hypothetical protein LUD79_05835 [Oscillospiraceae bacterium]|nr:hypothetical protein [Oscillospiraceae bacterium]
MYKSDAEAFRAYAQAHNTTVNALLREYVAECLGRPLERRDGSNEVNASEENPGEDTEN